MAKKLLNDSNQAVLVTTMKFVGQLSLGMRKPFQQSAKQLFSLVLVKLKEKKTILVEETKTCLLNMLVSAPIEEVVEDLKEAFADKTSTSKLNTL